MQPQPLEKRSERLEQRVTVLEQLPARVDNLALEISQLRDEMRVEFSAVRLEMRTIGDEMMSQSRTLYEDMKVTIKLLGEGHSSSEKPPR